MKTLYKKYLEEDHNFDKSTLLGIICLIIVISGVFGFLYEFVFYYFNSGMTEFYWRGSNFLPWINIYAIGAVFIFFLLYKKRKNPLLVFFASMLITGILEYIGGWMLYEFQDGLRCWDYNYEILNFGNINGFVCLRSVLFFGFSSLLLIYLIVPFCFYLAKKMNKKTFLIITIGLCSIFLFDELYNLIFARILSLPRASDIYKSLGFHYIYF
ncbi:MAG TPA: putative ABC transporter permease [Candidatus Pelethosoma merdigallinarum]|nr:putative ABC transporter permease [Candidatus Pelethosoma merdigallinarum]